ncbi:MAG: hypothetical protein ABMA25_18105, partial [Ilumatobacteraceae bacterium]
MLDAVHEQVTGDLKSSRFGSSVALLLVGESAGWSESEQVVRGGVVRLLLVSRAGDVVSDAEAEGGIVVELEQTRQFSFSHDGAAGDVRRDNEHGTGQACGERPVEAIRRGAGAQIAAVAPDHQPSRTKEALEFIGTLGA